MMVSLLKKLIIEDNRVIVENQFNVGYYNYNYTFDNANKW